MSRRFLLTAFLYALVAAAGMSADAAPLPEVVRRHLIAYVTRQQYAPDHHNTGTDFTVGEVSHRNLRQGAAIRTVDFARNGLTATLLEAPQGLIRDLEVSHDGTRLLFAMRRNAAENFRIFEMHADGSGLRQLTDRADAADMDPVYLPDGRIVFSSTRDLKYCGCNQHIMANLFVMNADGSDIRQLGRSTLYESRPSVLADGRILYDRWEYVDRHFGPSFGLWTMLPDVRNPALFYGNNARSPGAIFDARPRGGRRLLCRPGGLRLRRVP